MFALKSLAGHCNGFTCESGGRRCEVFGYERRPGRPHHQEQQSNLFPGLSSSGQRFDVDGANARNAAPHGVIVGDDPRSGKIFAQGTKEEHAEVARLLKATGDAQGSRGCDSVDEARSRPK